MTTCSSIIKAKHSKQEIERPQETIRPITILGFELKQKQSKIFHQDELYKMILI
jgi:hypothetical protein